MVGERVHLSRMTHLSHSTTHPSIHPPHSSIHTATSAVTRQGASPTPTTWASSATVPACGACGYHPPRSTTGGSGLVQGCHRRFGHSTPPPFGPTLGLHMFTRSPSPICQHTQPHPTLTLNPPHHIAPHPPGRTRVTPARLKPPASSSSSSSSALPPTTAHRTTETPAARWRARERPAAAAGSRAAGGRPPLGVGWGGWGLGRRQ